VTSLSFSHTETPPNELRRDRGAWSTSARADWAWCTQPYTIGTFQLLLRRPRSLWLPGPPKCAARVTEAVRPAARISRGGFFRSRRVRGRSRGSPRIQIDPFGPVVCSPSFAQVRPNCCQTAVSSKRGSRG